MSTSYWLKEMVWEAILSTESHRIHAAFDGLDQDNQHTILHHLGSMTSERGWPPEQSSAARIALSILEKKSRV